MGTNLYMDECAWRRICMGRICRRRIAWGRIIWFPTICHTSRLLWPVAAFHVNIEFQPIKNIIYSEHFKKWGRCDVHYVASCRPNWYTPTCHGCCFVIHCLLALHDTTTCFLIQSAVGLGGSAESAAASKLKTPQRVLFVEELSQSLIDHFPSFYRLGHAYFEG